MDGLSVAGEWGQLGALIPTLKGKRVLDLGCGYGWHCRYAAEQGAVRVLGIDASQKMPAVLIATALTTACAASNNTHIPRICGIA